MALQRLAQLERKIENQNEKNLEYQRGNIDTTASIPRPRLDPMERAKHYPACPYDIRMYDPNFDLFFCARNMKPPYTERKIINAETRPERCKQCVAIHQQQERLNALIREKKSDRYSAKPRIDWGKAEAYPNDGWF